MLAREMVNVYSIEDALADCEQANFHSNPDANQRLNNFIATLTNDQIAREYVDLAGLFHTLPFRHAAQLALRVIEHHLLPSEAWPDILLWSFSAIRLVPVEDTVWISRNYYALALKAIGERERAEEILRENWMSERAGSGTAYEWISGRDINQSATAIILAKMQGREEEHETLYSRADASWFDRDSIDSAKQGSYEVLMGLVATEEKRIGFEQFVENDQGLTLFLLNSLGETEPDTRDAALLAVFEVLQSHFRLDDPLFLLGRANAEEENGGDYGIVIDFLSLAVLRGLEDAYLPLVGALSEKGFVEQAIGYANVAVWKNIPGSGEALIRLLGLDRVSVAMPEGEISESTKVQILKMANGQY